MTSSSSLLGCFGDEWTPLSPRMPYEGKVLFAWPSLDQDRHFMLLEMFDENGYSSSVIWEYTYALKNITSHTPLPEVMWFGVTAIDNHRFLVVGGTSPGTVCGKSCRVYDTRTREWSQDWPDLNIGRIHHTCVTTNNKVYVIGGYNYEEGGELDSIEELDLSVPTPRWRILPQRLQCNREVCCAAVDPKDPNKVIVVGGRNKSGVLASCETVSLEEEQEGQTRTMPSLTTERYNFSLVAVKKRFLVVIGGERVTEGTSERLSSVEVLDLYEAPEEQQWRALPSMRIVRRSFAALFSPRNNKIVVMGGGADPETMYTLEELQVHGLERRAPLPRQELGQDKDGWTANRPHHQPLGKPPPLTELPTGCLDATHQGRIQQWLVESEAQMMAFVAQIDARETELVRERDANRQMCEKYVAQVDRKQGHARGILACCIQDTSTAGNAGPNQTNSAFGMPGNDGAAVELQNQLREAALPTTTFQMDGTHQRRMEVWIEEMEKHKNGFVSAVERRERELLEEMNENRRVCNEYVEQVRMGQRKAKAKVRVARGSGLPHELLCPITHEVMVDPVMTADGHTYERAAIECVFEGTRQGVDVRSPLTGLMLSSRVLTPNVAIRSMCVDYMGDS